MFTRAISGAVYVAVLIASILYSSYSFLLLFFVFMLISIFEFSKMLKFKNYWLYLLGTLFFGLSCTAISQKNEVVIESIIILTILLFFIKNLFTPSNDAVKDLGASFLTLIYTCLPFVFISKLPFINSTGTYEALSILGIFILIWSNDTFAYLFGVTIGKHKLLERISPKKTIEGFVGGVVCTMIIAYILSIYFDFYSRTQWIIIGAIVSIFGVLGDLIASMFKRQTGIKDTGNIIPGHGGIIDRLDSIIFAAPFIYIYLKITFEHVS